MRRSGKKDGEQGKEGQGKEGDGKDGKDGKDGQGKQGEGKDGQGKDGKPGQKDGGETDPSAPPQQSDASGKGQGDRQLGDESNLKTGRVDKKVDGEQGSKGESKSEVIKGASEEGFASRKYKDVYGDYSEVVEEVMEKDNVPKGYRYYVKRYFQLIKPREQD